MNFVSPVTHTESVETASTIDNMVKKAKSLGLRYISVTDSGYLAGVLKTYQVAEKNGIKAIPGIEAYFYDKNCNIIAGKKSFKSKYFQIVIHALDQDSYHMLCRINSSDKNMVKIRDVEYPAMTWDDLKFLSENGRFTVTTTSYNCMVFKPFLLGEDDVSDLILLKLKKIFKENLYLSLFTSPANLKWGDVVKLTLSGGKKIICNPNDRVFTNGFHNSKASDIVKNINRHNILNGIIRNGIKFNIKQENRQILSAKTESSYFLLGMDLHEKINKRVVDKSTELDIKILLNDNAFFADKGDKIIQDMKLSDYKRFGNPYWINSFQEASEYLKEIGIDIELYVKNNEDWAEKWKDFKFEYKPKIPCFTQTPLEDTIRIIKEKGRMKWNDPVWCNALKEELELFSNNGVINLLPYFLNLVDITDFYYKNNWLAGAGRGSSSGSKLAYLLGITHVDPIKYNLSSARFLTMGRVKSGKLPDIDWDSMSKIELVGEDGNSGFLFKKYSNRVAQVSTRTMLRLKSSILDANRFKYNDVEDDILRLNKTLPNPPQGINDYDFVFGYELDGSYVQGAIETSYELRQYKEKRPDEWEIVEKSLGLTRQYSKHACSYIISQDYINNYIPTFKIGGVDKVTQYEAKQCEWAGMIKYDFLVVRCLLDINDCMKRINKKYKGTTDIPNWSFIHNNNPVFIWDLPYSEGVFKDISDGKTETVFQLGTSTMTPTCIKFKPDSIEDLAVISSLQRPGPANYIDPEFNRNMPDEYIERKFGRSCGNFKVLDNLIPETYGILCIAKNSKVKTKEGQKNIQDVKVDDFVQTEDGTYQRVINTANNGIKKTIRIRLDNSEELILTPDHKVLTDIGWIEAQNLNDRRLVKHFWTEDNQIPEGTDQDWLIGLMLADGDLCATTPTIACSSKDFAEQLKIIADNTFDFLDCSVKFRLRCWYVGLRVKKELRSYNKIGPVRELLVNLNLYKKDSFTKKFPYISKKMIEGFIEGDGCLFNNRIRIKNESMARDIFNGLQSLKIKSSLFLEDNDTVNTVGFDPSLLNFKIKKKIKRINNGIFYPKNLFKYKVPRKSNNRQYFYPKLSIKRPFISEHTLKNICAENGFDFDFSNTWSRVIRIKNGEDLEVHDLTVEKNHSFVVGGSVVHNCYQEQLSEIVMKIGGFSQEESEEVREACGKKLMKKLDSIKPKFIDGAINRISKEEAEKLWDMMITFGAYGFNKSHAISYAFMSYACAFLKHHYPLEWWASVISNATTKEINEQYFKYIKELIAPPDINTSTEEIEVDYENNKIRAKLSMISGIGEKASQNIINMRPFNDLRDIVSKKPCNVTVLYKLTIIGAMDSFFKEEVDTEGKLNTLASVIADVEWEEKGMKGKKPNAQVPEKYMFLTPKSEFLIKKEIYPNALIDLFDILMKEPITKMNKMGSFPIINNDGKDYRVFNVELFKNVESNILKDTPNGRDITYVVPGYVISCETFNYAKNTKKAFKCVVDFSGITVEKVMWPDYEQNEVIIPDIKKGSVAYFGLNKRINKEDSSIKFIVVESY